MQRLVVGITGASGVVYGIRLVELLREKTEIETHVVVSAWGRRTIQHETDCSLEHLESLASVFYSPTDMGAKISSGSFLTDGMVIIPCSMRSLAAVATGQGTNLVHRAADVVLKERRRLVLVPREAPFNEIHLANMLTLSRMGACIFPASPGFYQQPKNLGDLIDQLVYRVLDQLGIHLDEARRWQGEIGGGKRP